VKKRYSEEQKDEGMRIRQNKRDFIGIILIQNSGFSVFSEEFIPLWTVGKRGS
jgi:hypothetical protein